MKKLSLLIVILLLSVLDSYAYGPEKEDSQSSDSLEIKCILKDHERKIKNVVLIIYKEGALYQEMETSNGKFKLELPKGSHFLLVFKSDRHHSKSIAVNTEVDNPEKEVPRLDLTMTLVPTELNYLSEYDQDLLDFPVAYLAYDSEKNTFHDLNEEFSLVLLENIIKKSEKHQKEMYANLELSMN